MTVALAQLGQISLPIRDVDAAEAFYGGTLGLRKLYRFGSLTFYDVAGVRLFLDGTREGGRPFAPSSTVLYFRTPDIRLTRRELAGRGVQFDDEPHLIAAMEDHDLWMTFFRDPDGNTLALMMEAPKGFTP
jgi:methylmalonyl-CoA/ethylmalonyl-CoA epimerase